MQNPPHPFLTAEWRYLAMLNYAVDPALLAPFVPAGTELDRFEGRTYVSLVGFRFERIRIRRLWIPFHSSFDEVNLRFYVKREVQGAIRRGVVFISEIVPRWAVAKVAQLAFHEKYVSLPMQNRLVGPTSESGAASAEYRWRKNAAWNSLRVEYQGAPRPAAEGSLDQFITEHYWGYASRPDGGSLEYRVEHPSWRLWKTSSASFTGDAGQVYGKQWSVPLAEPPLSAFMAEGSTVAVYPGTRLK